MEIDSDSPNTGKKGKNENPRAGIDLSPHIDMRTRIRRAPKHKTFNPPSMIPQAEDAKARRQDAIANGNEQSQVDDHVHRVNPEDKPAPYSDDLFKEIAIQWLIETNQPVAAFEHPSFQHMIHLASRATRGVQIPNRKQARDEIISLFK